MIYQEKIITSSIDLDIEKQADKVEKFEDYCKYNYNSGVLDRNDLRDITTYDTLGCMVLNFDNLESTSYIDKDLLFRYYKI